MLTYTIILQCINIRMFEGWLGTFEGLFKTSTFVYALICTCACCLYGVLQLGDRSGEASALPTCCDGARVGDAVQSLYPVVGGHRANGGMVSE